MLTTEFATYASRRAHPFALPLTLAGAGCHHGSRRCLTCHVMAEGYAASMRWAAGLTFDPEPFDLAELGDQTIVQLELPFEVNA
jgi:hypothetical protein